MKSVICRIDVVLQLWKCSAGTDRSVIYLHRS